MEKWQPWKAASGPKLWQPCKAASCPKWWQSCNYNFKFLADTSHPNDWNIFLASGLWHFSVPPPDYERYRHNFCPCIECTTDLKLFASRCWHDSSHWCNPNNLLMSHIKDSLVIMTTSCEPSLLLLYVYNDSAIMTATYANFKLLLIVASTHKGHQLPKTILTKQYICQLLREHKYPSWLLTIF